MFCVAVAEVYCTLPSNEPNYIECKFQYGQLSLLEVTVIFLGKVVSESHCIYEQPFSDRIILHLNDQDFIFFFHHRIPRDRICFYHQHRQVRACFFAG